MRCRMSRYMGGGGGGGGGGCGGGGGGGGGGLIRCRTCRCMCKERLREMCILRWSKVAARPSGWCRSYKAKEQKAWL